MSALSDFMTQSGFWWGTGLGAVLSGVITSAVTTASVRASDKRKAGQEDKTLDRKEGREDEKESEQRVRKACTEFAGVCAEVLTASIDVKGLFNSLRDAFNTDAGLADPMALQKLMFAETQVEEMKRVAKAYNDLKMEVPGPIMQAATRLLQSLQTVAGQTTDPVKKALAVKVAGGEMDNFINVFRDYFKLDRYSANESARDTASFLDTLKKQVHDFTEEAQRDMKAAGFQTTPWDVPTQSPPPNTRTK